MFKQTLPIKTLYHDYANLYRMVAEDRDFESESRYFLERTFRLKHCLELFAGPAWHSLFLKKHGVNVYCVDSSPAMKEIAVNQNGIDIDHYLTGSLPKVLQRLPRGKFDCVLVMRFSIGYLEVEEVETLLRYLFKKLNKSARVFVELHDLSLVFGGFSDLPIQKRTRRLKDKKIECQWPAGRVKVDPDRPVLQLPVTIRVLDKQRQKSTTHRFHSVERLYTCEDLVYFSKRAGFSAQRILGAVKPFRGSRIVELER